jgi:hypothetical protein
MDFWNNKKMYYFYDPAGGLMQRAVCGAGHDPVLTSFFGPFVREGTQGPAFLGSALIRSSEAVMMGLSSLASEVKMSI